MNKRIAVSVGLVAIGTSAVHAVAADAPKPWAAGVALRAFYDNNYTTATTDSQQSWGWSVAPRVSLNLPLEQTLIVGSYAYSYAWYADRDKLNLTPYDQTHNFNIDVTHTFSERLNGSVGDNFVVGQEPRLVDPSLGTAGRANGDNIRNSGYIGLNAVLTQLLTGSITYNNTLIDYEEKGALFDTSSPPQLTSASRSGLLDRIDHTISLQLGWQVSHTMTAFLAYSFDAVCYTGNEVIAQIPVFVSPGVTNLNNIMSSARNAYTHSASVGVQYAASEILNASASVGLQYSDNYNDPGHTTSLSPYAAASLAYLYTTGSSLNFAFSHSRNATDVVEPLNGRITTSQESSAASIALVHQITPMLTGNCNGSVTASTFDGGLNDGKTDWVYEVGVSLHYSITEHLGIETSYMHYKVESALGGRSYDRDRFDIGITANY